MIQGGRVVVDSRPQRFFLYMAGCLAMSLAGGSCALVDAFDDGETIEYPESGIYGLNLLAKDFTEANLSLYEVRQYSFRAELGDQASLRVKIISYQSFGYVPVDNLGWVIDRGPDGPDGAIINYFVALKNHSSADDKVFAGSADQPARQGSEKLEIEYFENDALTPTFTKTVFLHSQQAGDGDAGVNPADAGTDVPDAQGPVADAEMLPGFPDAGP